MQETRTEAEFVVSDVKDVSMAGMIGGHTSVVVEFSKDKKADLRNLRLNLISDRFALMNRRFEVLGIVRTVGVGVDTCRLSVPVKSLDEAKKLYQSIKALGKKLQDQGK